MKYYKLNYDANRPSTKQITVPTNSDYGVAVKVEKDGEFVENAGITVGGKEAQDLVAGWKTVELSSGSTPTTQMFSVDVESPATLDETLDVVAEGENTSTSRMRNVQFEADLSAYFDHDITIKPEDVEVVSMRNRSGTVGEEYPDDWRDTFSQYCEPNIQITFKNSVWGYGQNFLYCRQKVSSRYPAEQDYTWKYFKTGVGNVVESGERTIPLDTKIFITIEYMQPLTKAQYEVVIKLNTHDGFESKFTLLVQAQDKGYIELETKSEQ